MLKSKRCEKHNCWVAVLLSFEIENVRVRNTGDSGPRRCNRCGFKCIENAARRASGGLLTAPDVSATKDEMIAKEIREMHNALQAFSGPPGDGRGRHPSKRIGRRGWSDAVP
jgi:hypothetical protein